MAHEIEKLRDTTPDAYQGYQPERYPVQPPSVPSWMEARPHYRPDSDIERHWSNVMVWPRLLLIFLLWITETWYKSALALAFVVIIILMFQSK